MPPSMPTERNRKIDLGLVSEGGTDHAGVPDFE